MRTMNDAVKDRLGALLISLCEAEVFLAERDARIAELERKLSELNTGGPKPKD